MLTTNGFWNCCVTMARWWSEPVSAVPVLLIIGPIRTTQVDFAISTTWCVLRLLTPMEALYGTQVRFHIWIFSSWSFRYRIPAFTLGKGRANGITWKTIFNQRLWYLPGIMLHQQYNDSMGNHKNISMYALYMGKIRKYNICHFLPTFWWKGTLCTILPRRLIWLKNLRLVQTIVHTNNHGSIKLGIPNSLTTERAEVN